MRALLFPMELTPGMVAIVVIGVLIISNFVSRKKSGEATR